MRLFVLLSRFPYPLEKGDKLRAYYQLKYLAQNHELHLYCVSDINVKNEYIKHIEKYCKHITIVKNSYFSKFIQLFLAILKKQPLQVGYFYHKKLQKKLDKDIKIYKPEHIFAQLIRTAKYVCKYKIPKTLDYQDAFSKGVQRRITEEKGLKKWVMKYEYKQLLKYESVVFDCFTNKVIISEQDRECIKHIEKSNIQIVRNGVNTAFFSPIKSKKQYDLVFVGNMNYPPNIKAAEYIVKEILPEIEALGYNIKIMISGANPHKRVRQLVCKNVHISGWVEDIRESYAQSKIFIAPMQIGIGLQNKLLEAMAMEIPCITSPLANNALKAIPNEQILIGNDKKSYAKAIITLLEDVDFAKKIAQNGRHYVIKNYNWHATTMQLEKIMFDA